MTSKTESSISVQLAGMDSSYSKSDRICSWYIDGVKKGSVSLGANILSGGNYTFTGLSSGTTYTIRAHVSTSSWYSDFETDASTESPSIQRWSWSSSNGSASSSETKASYNSLFKNGNVSDFSYKVWNDLCDKTYEANQVSGSYWASDYTTYLDAKMSSGNKVLTAAKFNSLRLNIGRHVSTGIQEVSSGDIVYGWYFTTLARCLNEWIDSL